MKAELNALGPAYSGTPHSGKGNEKISFDWGKHKSLFIDAKTSKRAVNDFHAKIDNIIAANAIDGGHVASKVDSLDALFSTFDAIKDCLKPENKYLGSDSYSLQENAIVFCIDNVEVKKIAITNDSGSDEIILNGIRTDQWTFLSACYNRNLNGFDEMIDVLFPVCDLSVFDKQITAKNKCEYSGLKNSCPEKSALVLAKIHNIDCEFTLDDLRSYQSDALAQIDIIPPLSYFATDQQGGGLFTEGQSEAPVLDYFNRLDKDKPHLLRTGANNEAGHNVIISFEQGDWYLYEDIATKYQLTERDESPATEKLTAAGREMFVKPHASWGTKNGEVSICTLEATKTSTEALISYIKTYRKEGEAAAIAALHASHYEN